MLGKKYGLSQLTYSSGNQLMLYTPVGLLLLVAAQDRGQN